MSTDSTEVLPEESGPENPKRPKYPHLDNLARNDAVLHVKRVTVTEKLDGANVRFGVDSDGIFWAGSRNLELDLTDRGTSYGFVGWLLDEGIEARIRRTHLEGVTFYGEWVGPKVQGRIKYPTPGFYLFDVREGEFLSPGALDAYARLLNVSQAPRLYWGKPDLATLERLRIKPFLADISEGIVIKADPPQRDFRGNHVIAKFKNPAFEEVAKAKVRTPRDPADTAGAQTFVDTYVTLERLRHVFAQVREAGLDPADVRSTGDVLRAMHSDVTREGAGEYEALDKTNQRAVGSLCAKATKPLIEALVVEEREAAA